MGYFCRALSETTRDHLSYIYVPSTNATSVNELQYQMFCNRQGEVDSSEFHLVKTACLCMSFVLTTRLQFGGAACSANSKWNWITTDDNGQLAIERMRSSPAPDTVLQLLSCKCT